MRKRAPQLDIPVAAAYDGEKTSFTLRLIYRGILINRVSNLDNL